MDNLFIYTKDNKNTNLLQTINNTILFNTIMPVGSINQYAGAIEKVPQRWLICDGRTLDKVIYSDLFNVIGYIYDDSGTIFKIPDFRGRFPVGYSTIGTFNKLNKKEGSETQTLIESNIPSHIHNLFINNAAAGGTLTKNNYAADWNSNGNIGYYISTNPYIVRPDVGRTSSSGKGTPRENLPPYLVINYIIYIGNLQPYANSYDGYIIGPWPTDTPTNSTSGNLIYVPTTGTYIINVNISSYRDTYGINKIDIYINNSIVSYSLLTYINESYSHKTFIPIYFKKELTGGKNYIYFRQISGSSDGNDFASINVIPTSNNEGCNEGYITGGWSNTSPTPTSGTSFTITSTGTYVININASAWSNSTTGMLNLDVYINGVNTNYSIKSYINELTSHKTLVPLYFKYNLNQGTNYIYLLQTFGTSDPTDYCSFNWVPVLNNAGCYDGYITAQITGWPTIKPSNSTSGTPFTVSIAGNYVLNINASLYVDTPSVPKMDIYINGNDTNYSIKAGINENNSHKTLVPISFKYYLNQGTNYLYLYQREGFSDSNDICSFSWTFAS